MKKPVKIILTVCCIALVLFLLLPFLETASPAGKQAAAAAQTEPQIFTSNPLTELVSRIARFFGSKKTANQNSPAQTLTARQTDEQFGEPQETALYASAQTPASGGESASYSADSSAYADAYLQNEEGEWVLIRQTAPEGASRGMHEINAKDNAYDRYVQQERQARFTPVMRTPKTKVEVPDSKLARVFNPIKRFFGFGEKPADAGALQSNGGLSAGTLASSSGLDKNREKSSILPKARPIDWGILKNNPVSALTPGSAEAAEELLNLLNPSGEIEKTAKWLAELKYPDDPEEQNEYAKRLTREQMHQTSLEMQELMVRRNAGKEPVNVLKETIESLCGDGSTSKTTCKLNAEEQQQPSSEEDVSRIKDLSNARFFEQTGHPMPPAGITLVLNSTEMDIIDEDFLEEADDQRKQDQRKQDQRKQTVEFYRFMQDQCTDNCYWVATGMDKTSELAQTVEAAGLILKGDPLKRYEQYAQAYLEQKQNKVSEEELQELQKSLQKNTHYTAYSQSDLDHMFRDTMTLMRQKARPEEGTVPFFTHVENAYDFHQRAHSQHPVFYGQGSTVNGNNSLEERAFAFTDELAQFVNDVKEITQRVKQDAAEEGTQTLLQPAVRQIQEQLKNEMDGFNKTNDLGKTQK